MRDKQREETRRKLYLAALEVFRRDGFNSCRIDDIAQRAEVSRAAFYFHFPTKDDVLIDLVRDAEAPVAHALSKLPADASLEHVLTVMVEKTAAFWQNEPKLLVDALTTSLRVHALDAGNREAELMRRVATPFFKRAAARGELSGVLLPEVLGDFFLVNVFAAMLAWSSNPGAMPLEMMLKGVIHLFLSGAGAPKLPGSNAPRLG